MKKLAVLFALVVLTGCAATRPRIVSTGFIDYRPYTEGGFFLSPDPYPGDCESLGEIVVYVIPALVPAGHASATKFSDGAYGSVGVVREAVDVSELLELAYKEAAGRGADGLVDLKFTTESDAVGISKYEVSGLAIRRK